MKLLIGLTILSLTVPAFAREGHANHRAEKRAFRMGVCVGQALAAAGVDVSATDSVDDTSRAAFKNALESCKPAAPTGAPAAPSSDTSDSSGSTGSSSSSDTSATSSDGTSS